MIKYLRIPKGDNVLLELAFDVRTDVFIVEQKVDPAMEMDEYDATANHYLALDDDKPVATARWRQIGDKIKLERFAVDAAYRNKGVGGKILAMVLKDVLPLNKYTYLHAQLKAVDFYSRQGFVKEGDIFLECDIEHYNMYYLKSANTQLG